MSGVVLVLQTLAPDQQRLIVISVSPQSRASLAVRFQLNPTDTARKLTAFFKKLGRRGTLGVRDSLEQRGVGGGEGALHASESLNLNTSGTLF